MPELPEVEVTRLGIKPHIEGRRIDAIIVRNGDLRWPVPADIHTAITGTWIKTVARRGKFILIGLMDENQHDLGTLMVHLGMTGTLRVLSADSAVRLHDHIDIRLQENLLRYRDPRRFGAVLWHGVGEGPIADNRHLRTLGVEPLSSPFTESGGEILYRQTRGRSAPIKQILLAGQIVVGVGNIYASESLFRAGINPKTAAGRIGLERYMRLAGTIQDVLKAAIQKGGSTLRDFVGGDGASGYFQLDYFVYDRAGQPCRVCGSTILGIRQGQRSSFYCPRCQK